MAQLRYKQALACGTAITAVGLVGIYLYQKQKGENHGGVNEEEDGRNKLIEEKLVQDIMREKARLEEESKNGKRCNCEEGCTNSCSNKTDIESLHETLNQTIHRNCLTSKDRNDAIEDDDDKLLSSKLPDVISNPLVEEFLALTEEMELLTECENTSKETKSENCMETVCVIEENIIKSEESVEQSSIPSIKDLPVAEALFTVSKSYELNSCIPDHSDLNGNDFIDDEDDSTQGWSVVQKKKDSSHHHSHDRKEIKVERQQTQQEKQIHHNDRQYNERQQAKSNDREKTSFCEGNRKQTPVQSPSKKKEKTISPQIVNVEESAPVHVATPPAPLPLSKTDASPSGETVEGQTSWASAMEVVEGKEKTSISSPVSDSNNHESPTVSDGGSEVNSDGSSSDSGRGSSETSSVDKDQAVITEAPELPVLYQFEFPTTLCGRLIGKQGRNIKDLRDKSGAKVFLKNIPVTDKYQLCIVEGVPKSVEAAIAYIKKKFPDVDTTRQKLTADSQGKNVALPNMSQLHLPEEVINDVIVSSVVTAGHVFLQQPTHPTYSALNRLDNCMNICYSNMEVVPPLPKPVEVGIICAAPVLDCWYRAQIINYYPEEDEADVRFLDYGGYGRMDANMLRQIRSDFLTLPFQAVECYLANIAPLQGEMYFSDDARLVIEHVAQNFAILQSQITAYSMDGLPLVELFYTESENGNVHSVNRELVNRGLVTWYEGLEETIATEEEIPQMLEIAT